MEGFDGLALAIAVSAVLAPLELLGPLAWWRRTLAAVLVGLPYLVASYLIQGAFKETMEALFVLAFAISLHQLARGSLIGPGARRGLIAVPLAVARHRERLRLQLSRPPVARGRSRDLGARRARVTARRHRGAAAAGAMARAAAPGAAVALALLAAAAAPEIGRMVDFASFETFNPPGAGLGNLFNAISPLEALGIWPSGDFRLDPGDGAVPAIGYYLGELLGLAALAYGLAWWIRRREWAVPSALAAAVALYGYAHFAGTPYQAAKATVMASPLAMLIAARALLSPERIVELGMIRGAVGRTRTGPSGTLLRWQSPVGALLAVAFCGAAAACTVLALVNGPVGPASYSPALTELRPEVRHGSTLALVSRAPACRRAWARLRGLGASRRAGVRRETAASNDWERAGLAPRTPARGHRPRDRSATVIAAVRWFRPRAPHRSLHALGAPSGSQGGGPMPADRRGGPREPSRRLIPQH